MEYKISYSNPEKHFLNIELLIKEVSEDYIELQLPAWRPGRYELANFSKNIQKFKVTDQDEKELSFQKILKDRWRVKTNGAKEVKVFYNYYAQQMDAGGTWLDENMVYINFVNCLLYKEDKLKDPCLLELEIPDSYTIATGARKNGKVLQTPDFYTLVDSPVIAAKEIQHKAYTTGETNFNIWIHGNVDPEWEKLLDQFKSFTDTQIKTLGEFPEKDYHFLFHILPYRHYHGVEHGNSTVVTLGPASKFHDKDFYSNLLGISSHELFHAWNVCKIRPKEMQPYDFSKENYFETGYVAEGFTTYYGDLFLARSGVFSTEDYFKELSLILKRHYDNYGRFNKSLAESSIDLWLDGYSLGIPNRKVSIYVKGAVVALMLDLKLRKDTNGAKSLDDIIQGMWKTYGKTKTGYTSDDVEKICSDIAGVPYKDFFVKHVYSAVDEADELNNYLEFVGCSLSKKPSKSEEERKFGLRTTVKDDKLKVGLLAPGSPADKILAEGDEIVSVDSVRVEKNFNELISGKSKVILEVDKSSKVSKVELQEDGTDYFPTYTIEKLSKVTEEQKKQFYKWINKEF